MIAKFIIQNIYSVIFYQVVSEPPSC